MKRTIITLLALLSLSLMVPAAYAQEYIPEVSTLSELQQAIAEAEPGDTIRLLQTIDVDTPVTIGIDGKPLTLCAAAGVQTYLRFVGDWGTASYCELYDLSIDGDNYFPYDSLVTIDTPNAVYMTRLDFANGISDNVGGAVRIDRGQVYAASCTFKNCSATRGGAVYAPAGTSFCPSECGFIGNSASFDGGAIYCEGGGEIRDCTFTGNYAVNGSGGAVYAGNSVLIDRGTISGNTALYGGGVYVLDNGKSLMLALSQDLSQNRPAEAREHVRRFHELFFTLSPEKSAIEHNVKRALLLADKSVYHYYSDFAEKGYYNRIIAGNINQVLKVDSVVCDFNAYPYRAVTYATQKIIRQSNVTERSLVTTCRLLNASRSDDNPNGFTIEGFTIIENKDLQTIKR